MRKRIARFCSGENAAEVSELAMVLGLIVAGAILGIAAVGAIIQQFYVDFHATLP